MPTEGQQTTDPSSPRFAIPAGICALLLAGMVSGAALWIIAAIAAAMLLALNAWLARTWSTTSLASREGHDCEVKPGSKVPVVVRITNRASVPILWLLVEDLLPKWATFSDSSDSSGSIGGSTGGQISVDGERVRVMLLWAGQTESIQYTIHCNRRGYYQIGPTILETGDLMGLYRRYRVGTPPIYITVLPEVVPLTAFEIGSRRPIGEIRMRENVMDDPTRLRGIRQWQPGDPMRSVHWSATARTGTLHSKVYEPSSIIGATIVLDLHQSTTPRQHEPMRSDLATTAAASIAASLHDANEPFGLATNGRDAADRIRLEGWVGDHRVRDEATRAASMNERNERLRPIIVSPSRGPVQLAEVNRTLARLERTDGLTLTELLVDCESQLSAETTLLVILQQCTAESIAALISLSRRGRAVAVMINTHDINDYSEIAGPLIAARIPTFHLSSREVVAEVCRQTLVR